jgi:signal transduction histidine kinase
MSMRTLWRFMAFKRRFLILFSAAMILSGISTVYFVRFLLKPNTGLVVNFPEVIVRDGEVVFSPKTPFSPAAAAGLRPNQDVILKVNDRVIRGSRDIVAADGEIRTFDPFPVEVLRDGLPQRVMVLPSLTPARIDWLFVMLFALSLAFTTFYLILNLSEDLPSTLIALAALFYLVFTCLKPFYYESFFSNLMIHLGKLTSWLMAFFALYFPFRRGRKAARLLLMGGVLGLYLAFIALRMVYYAAWSAGGEELWLARYRLLGQLGNVSDGIAFLLYAALLVSAYFRTPRNSDKRQIEWFLAGFMIAIPPYFFLDQLPLILGEPPGLRMSMGNFADLFLMFWPLFFIVGLMKHRAFNIRFFVHRYIVYLILGAVIFAFFTVLYEPALKIFIASYGLPDRVAGFLVTVLLLLVLMPLRTLLTRLVERLFYWSFYQRSLHYSAGLETRNMELRMIIEELNRQNLQSFQSDKMRELKGIITGIAHRINNPANYISSGLAALEKNLRVLFDRLQVENGLSREELDRKRRENEQLLSIAREGDLLIRDFVRKLVSLAGSWSSISVSVEVSRLLRNAEAEVRRKYPDARLVVRIPDAAPVRSARLSCYPAELIQAILYIAENAIEALASSPGGGGLLLDGAEVIVLRAFEQDGFLAIEIADQGTGIDELNLKKVFDPFFTTKADHEGLGLYFSRMIVERNSGRVTIHSRPGEGTRVQLRFLMESQRRGLVSETAGVPEEQAV